MKYKTFVLNITLLFVPFILLLNCNNRSVLDEKVNELAKTSKNNIPGSFILELNLNGVKKDLIKIDENTLPISRVERSESIRSIDEKNEQIVKQYFIDNLGFADNISNIWVSHRDGIVYMASLQVDDITNLKLKILENSAIVDKIMPNEEFKRSSLDFNQEKDLGRKLLSSQIQNCAVSITGRKSQNLTNSTKFLWVLDVGLDYDNPDLNIETSSAVSVSTLQPGVFGSGEVSCPGISGQIENNTPNANHASFIAELAGAINNDIGGVGVAPNALFASVKVITCDGVANSGSVLRGLNWVAANSVTGDVVNLSFGTSAPMDCANPSSSQYYQHIQTVTATRGAYVVAAAGNSGVNVNSIRPAC